MHELRISEGVKMILDDIFGQSVVSYTEGLVDAINEIMFSILLDVKPNVEFAGFN